MFTGIVEELGEVVALEAEPDSARITVRSALVASEARRGQSIAVDGCCLTVVEQAPEAFTADVMAETLARTSLGALVAGSRVNLERALTPLDRLGGHLVQGHVDGVGTVVAREHTDRWDVVTVAVPPGLARYVASKGSVAVDGVSLTVSNVSDQDGTFAVSLVPTTLALTTLGFKQTGDLVNLEVDVVAKYIERLLAAHPKES
jgi:riboflavin synthase